MYLKHQDMLNLKAVDVEHVQIHEIVLMLHQQSEAMVYQPVGGVEFVTIVTTG